MITGMTLDAGATIAPAFMLKMGDKDITHDISSRLLS